MQTTQNFNAPGIHIVGGGLAGCEAAWQALKKNIPTYIYEMKKIQRSPAHHTENFAELVCSNSFKSMNESSTSGRLKAEMLKFDSIIISSAYKSKVPAGQALAVERTQLSKTVEDQLNSHPLFTRVDAEITELPSLAEMKKNNQYWIVATGPLTADGLSQYLKELLDPELTSLAFYDAIAPIISGDSIDMDIAFVQDRYGAEDTDGDYLNLPMNKEEYESFITEVKKAEYMPLHSFESTKYFEACLPIEVMAERGDETLRFGPMKPVGLMDVRTNEKPHAVIQLRKENGDGTMYSMVGFQTKMKWPEQKRVFTKIPGLKEAEFIRFGSVHRNTYFNSPKLLNKELATTKNPRLFLAGQITGVEGYTESSAVGILAGLFAATKINGEAFVPPPYDTIMGSLYQYVTSGCKGPYQPMNANFGLLPTVKKRMPKRDKKALQCSIAAQSFENYFVETFARTP